MEKEIIKAREDTPKVSVIVPVYNVEKYVGRCIESIQKQTLTEWELILVDDCGNDCSVDIIRQYAESDGRIILVDSDRNVGPMVARDKGTKMSKGVYVTYIDGDDTLPENALEILYNEALASKAEIVTGAALRINPDGTTIPFMPQKGTGLLTKNDVMGMLVTRSFPHNVCGKMFLGEAVRNAEIHGVEGLTNGEDGHYFLQILQRINYVKLTDRVVYYYWTYQTSSSHKKMTEKMVRGMAVYNSYCYEVLSKELGNINKDFYKTLYRGLFEISKAYPYKDAKRIYTEEGLTIDTSLINLLNYFTIRRSFKYYFTYHIYSSLFRI